MRIVLDTNVVISGLIWNGTPGKILAVARSRRAEIFTYIELLNELSRQLKATIMLHLPAEAPKA
ncbi:putative toxin-antitoxin system toxin component, PIN family [Duganella sp. HH101]|uniref:putative toxin-antitoxin system toxin component, PIN family n=1 Tax=Duganella sp. HH101 TaxID=1781066 RepID=UPI000873744D|nr:putative toxin-antitoxin system toxin component, PIN family [Duganella sp. HH101]